ncbi:hypothetical protein ACMBCN_02555, partial [Candidatus Liberibacter asiaticus]|nr:hypothetical protein [Candidatus Liberibacter asiaticus]
VIFSTKLKSQLRNKSFPPQTYHAYCPQYVIRKTKQIKDEKTPSKLVVVKYLICVTFKLQGFSLLPTKQKLINLFKNWVAS